VAPPGNQAANRENKLQPKATEGPGLLDTNLSGAFDLLIDYSYQHWARFKK
jgi:hypothetical protein